MSSTTCIGSGNLGGVPLRISDADSERLLDADSALKKLIKKGILDADSAQQALVEACRVGWKDRKGEPIGIGWIRRRARSRELNEIRRRVKEKETLERLSRSPLLSHIADPRQLAEAAELAMLVQQIFADFHPEMCRRVLHMFLIDELDYDEICEQLTIPRGTAGCHVYRGLIKLREKLIARGILDDFREAIK
jgi:RNA polymerase sigma factor (sigma-70 family)